MRARQVADFYPTEFKVDMNGARMAWMGVALLPFIDESRLLAIARSLEPTLSEEEKHRNSLHAPRLFVSSKHKNFAAMQKACQGSPADLDAAMKQRVPLEPARPQPPPNARCHTPCCCIKPDAEAST